MAGETQVTVVGNLTADPELRFTGSGVAVVKFTVASTPRTYDKNTSQWKDGDTLFLGVSAWREFAEHIAETLHKGDRVIVVGSLGQRNWETKEGEKRTSYEITASSVGPDLLRAVAKVERKTKSQGGQRGGDDPWAGSGTQPAGGFDDEPPF